MNSYIGDIDNKYTLTKKIGSGGTSKVYLAFSNDNPKEQFAIKIIKNSNSSENKVFLNEVNVLKKIKHTNVVGLADGGEGILTKSGKKYQIQYIVLELIKYGELFDYIFFPQKGFGEEIGKYIFTQLIDGLEACHKSGIVHRDMKTENIMLGENWEMKLADFGFSTKIEGKKGNGLLYTALGTASYASPELLQKKPYDGAASDIFSLGVSLFVLVTGKMPFKHALTDDPYYKEVVNGKYKEYWTKLESKVPHTSQEFKELFVNLIAYDPKIRPTLEDCKNCSWMKGYKPNLQVIDSEFTARTKVVQHKKELERKKEEAEEMERRNKKEGHEHYRGEETVFVETSNNLQIEDFDDDYKSPYIFNYPNENSPGVLIDFITWKIKQHDNKAIKLLKVENEYKLAVGIEFNNDKEILVSGEPIQDSIEALLEIKKVFDGGLKVEVSRTSGNKFDFYNLFNELEQVLIK